MHCRINKYKIKPSHLALVVLSILSSGCTMMSSGPSARVVKQAAEPVNSDVQLIDITPDITHQLARNHKNYLFSDALKQNHSNRYSVGPGDVLDFSIWEIPPATLFTTPTLVGSSGKNSSPMNTLPSQVISQEGTISFPFAGTIHVAGLTVQQIQDKIRRALKGKANKPQVLVRLAKNTTSAVTIVGEVVSSRRLPLTPSKERLLDALAAAKGVKTPVNKTMIQVTRGQKVYSLPLDIIIRDPHQNIVLQAGDVITALFQSKSFTVLGATGKSEEINFEAQGINLAQALGRSGGLQDHRANISGVFVFRFEQATAIHWPRPPRFITAEGRVPVIYRLDLKNPRSFFVAQSFSIQDHDILYVSNAPMAELQKFLGVLATATAPLNPFLYAATIAAS
ncbi:polysaccharide biosynthesis/export family protein [Legionella sp. PC997]|uniref:polysaccharide biosynthesis/export family protein n=1 Tax=Legionella sp. PC997 TaxID=2755562 RepID=UPI0015FD76C8|nr:polysaccharide biosynthesis/export family protein [Legionella sp. PC997]QMT61594.1 hypothetical protein HBNCFIEN_02998 [Legionella sp. PC997]